MRLHRGPDRDTGQRFLHKWALEEALGRISETWRPLPDTKINKTHNKDLEAKLSTLYRVFGGERRR